MNMTGDYKYDFAMAHDEATEQGMDCDSANQYALDVVTDYYTDDIDDDTGEVRVRSH